MAVTIYTWNSTEAAQKAKILKRSETDISDIINIVGPIVNDVRVRGDEALCAWTAKFDYPGSCPETLWASDADFEEAERLVKPEVKKALAYAINNVKTFHEMQKPRAMELIQVRPGIMAAEKWVSIDKVALYVPHGKGSFPSMLYMLAIPAIIAGVKDIIICTPPERSGSIDAACLVTARMLGLTRVLRAGGSQAIAALAYGTKQVPAVDKIVGPSSGFVAAAKRLVADVVDPGLPAGPSESIVLADESAQPANVALDLLVEAEHGPDSSALLVTPSMALAEAVKKELETRIALIPGQRRDFVNEVFSNYGGIVVTETMEEACEWVNTFAPEHLNIQSRDPWALSARIRHAGEILLGSRTPFSAANYCTGPNAVLPTGGKARTYGAVSVRDFMHTVSIIEASPEGYQELRDPTVALAEYEGFYTHAHAFLDRTEES